jgi:hypothetical protein
MERPPTRIGALAPLTVPTWLAVVLHAAGTVVIALYLLFLLQAGSSMNDAWGFWIASDGGLYDIPWLERYAYVYSPAFAQIIGPLTGFDWEVFWVVWLFIQMGALVLLAGPFWAGVIVLLPWPSIHEYPNAVVATIENGNPQLLLALAIAAGLRWPAAWALPLLTKVTPGVGILWFAVRREWGRLAVAVGVAAGIVLVSLTLDSALWIEWTRLLGEASTTDTLRMEPILPLPLVVRAPIGLALLTWGALTNRYWTVPIACMLCLPAIQLGGFALLVGAIPFVGLPLTPSWPLPYNDHGRRRGERTSAVGAGGASG